MAPSQAICSMPLRNCFALHGIQAAQPLEVLGREGRDGIKLKTSLAAVHRVSLMEKMPGSNTPMMSPA